MCGDGIGTMTRANILIASAGTPPAIVVVGGGNGRLDRVAAMPKQPVASDSGLLVNRGT